MPSDFIMDCPKCNSIMYLDQQSNSFKCAECGEVVVIVTDEFVEAK